MDSNLNLERKKCTISMDSLDFNYHSLQKVKLHGQFREAAGKIWSDIILSTKLGVIPLLTFHWQWT